MEIEKLKSILKCKKGSSFPLIIAVTLSLVMIFTGISEYFRLLIIAQGVRDTLQSAVISTVVGNYDDVYHSVREGYSGAYQPIASSFEESLDYGNVYSRLDKSLGLLNNGGVHEKRTKNGKLEYKVYSLSVKLQNAPFASADKAHSRFEADCIIMLEAPVSFVGELLPPMKIKLKTTAGYTPKF